MNKMIALLALVAAQFSSSLAFAERATTTCTIRVLSQNPSNGVMYYVTLTGRGNTIEEAKNALYGHCIEGHYSMGTYFGDSKTACTNWSMQAGCYSK